MTTTTGDAHSNGAAYQRSTGTRHYLRQTFSAPHAWQASGSARLVLPGRTRTPKAELAASEIANAKAQHPPGLARSRLKVSTAVRHCVKWTQWNTGAVPVG